MYTELKISALCTVIERTLVVHFGFLFHIYSNLYMLTGISNLKVIYERSNYGKKNSFNRVQG